MTKERVAPEIGKRLRAIRGEMNQRGFASRLDVSQQAISNYEQGNLPDSWDFLRRLSREWGVNLHWLLEGMGTRDIRAGSALAGLADNRSASWPRAFLEQIAFAETDALGLLLDFYFLYLATEPADVKARLMADLQKLVEAARVRWQDTALDERDVLGACCDSLARDDRAGLVDALLRAGDRRLDTDRRKAVAAARGLFFAAHGLARLQGWPADQLESSRRIARSYRLEGRWQDAEAWYRTALATFEAEGEAPADESAMARAAAESAAARETDAARSADRSRQVVPPEARARVLLGYGHVAREQGDIGVARTRYLAALRWALESQDPSMRAEVYLDLACLSYREKDFKKAAEFVAAGRTFAQRADDRRLVNQFELADALLLREQGRLEEAEGVLRKLLPRAQVEHDLDSFSLGSLNLSEVLVDLSRLDEARELLGSSLTAAEEFGNPRNLALRKLLQARIATAGGDEAAAAAHLLECMRYSRDQGLTAEFDQAAGFWSRREAASQPAYHAG